MGESVIVSGLLSLSLYCVFRSHPLLRASVAISAYGLGREKGVNRNNLSLVFCVTGMGWGLFWDFLYITIFLF
jgi:hypothetical protein